MSAMQSGSGIAEEAVFGGLTRGVYPAQSRFAGQPIRPLGIKPNGDPLWPILGAAPDEDEDDEDKDDSAGGGGQDSDDDDKDDADADDKGKPKEGSIEARLAALESEKDRQFRRRKEAETERDRLKAEIESLRGDKDKDGDASKQIEEMKADNQALAESLREMQVQVAFLKDNTHAWRNPSTALRLADLSQVEIESDGSVHGLREALDALAKSDPYLLADKDEKDDKKDRPPRSGDQRNGSKKDQGKDAEGARKKALLDKYPGLRR